MDKQRNMLGIANWLHLFYLSLETRVHFLEILLKFKNFRNITRGVTGEIICWNYCSNIIFTSLRRQLKFNILRIKSNQFDHIRKILFNEIKVFY